MHLRERKRFSLLRTAAPLSIFSIGHCCLVLSSVAAEASSASPSRLQRAGGSARSSQSWQHWSARQVSRGCIFLVPFLSPMRKPFRPDGLRTGSAFFIVERTKWMLAVIVRPELACRGCIFLVPFRQCAMRKPLRPDGLWMGCRFYQKTSCLNLTC